MYHFRYAILAMLSLLSACVLSDRPEEELLASTPDSSHHQSDTLMYDYTVSNDSLDIALCKLIYTEDYSDAKQDMLSELLLRGANADCVCELSYSVRKMGTYVPVVKHFYRRKYREHIMVTSPLHLAINREELPLIKKLLASGAQVNKPSKDGIYPLEIAIQTNNQPIVDYLIAQKADPKLICLCYSQNIKTIKSLIALGADSKTIDINFALDNPPLLKQLLALKPDLNRYPMDTRRLLNNLEVLELLLDHGLSPNAKGTFPDECPIIFSAIKYTTDDRAFDLLLERGAKLTGSCRTGFADNLLIAAVDQQRYSIVKKLIDKGLDPNAADWTKQTPVYYAITRDDERMIRLLVEHGADIHYNKYFNHTPLYVAVQLRKYTAAKTFIDLGAEVNYVDKYGSTPLVEAIENNDLAMAKLLVSNGADLDYRYQGQTLIEYAQEKNASPSIITLLSP